MLQKGTLYTSLLHVLLLLLLLLRLCLNILLVHVRSYVERMQSTLVGLLVARCWLKAVAHVASAVHKVRLTIEEITLLGGAL